MSDRISIIVVFLIIGIIIGAVLTTSIILKFNRTPETENTALSSQQNLTSVINELQMENQQLRSQLSSSSQVNSSIFGIDPVSIYQRDNRSVVTVQGIQQTISGPVSVLGSGFVISYLGHFYIVTNYHVVQNLTNGSVTFSNGDAYPMRVIGIDPYSDLAIVNITAPQSEFVPLRVDSSSSVHVGEPVVAIGNPFGLSGSITLGIVSQVGRTITESLAGNFPIADVIQFSAPVNPGNSGGPLLNAKGDVIGITTAVYGGSQGVGFAIPSDTLLRELPFLVKTGKYDMHPYLGIESVDMNFQIANYLGINVTYGVLVEQVINGGPAYQAGVRGGTKSVVISGTQYLIGGDIIVSINGTRLINTDSLSTYLEEHTLPGQDVVLGIIRNGTLIFIQVTLGVRPPLS